MILEAELTAKLAACRLQALRDALTARPAVTIAIGGFENGMHHKETAIQELIDAEKHRPMPASDVAVALETLHAAGYVKDPDYTAIKDHIAGSDKDPACKDHITLQKNVASQVFEYAKISVLAYANGFTLWHYKCDEVSQIIKEFFFDAADLLSVGDVILCSGANGARIVYVVAVAPPQIVSMF